MAILGRMLLAAAGGVIALGAHAQSSVQLMGTVDTFVGSMRMAGDTGRRTVVGSGGMTTSWFGFKGTEDLGGGLKANFALTAFFQADSGTAGRFANDPFFSRDANVSLSGRFGTVMLGRGLAPNFLPTILFNPFGDSFTFSPLVLHNNVPLFNPSGWAATTPSDTGWANEILYTTPNFGGLTANFHYQFGEVANDNGVRNFGANLLFFKGPFAATAFYESDDLSNPVPARFTGDARRTDWMLGASWDFTAAKLFGTYGRSRTSISPLESRTVSLGGTVPVGAGKIMLGTARTEYTPGRTRRTTTVGYDHNLSKRTDVYVNVMRDTITTFSGGTSFGAGIRHRF
ncbi:porin [Ramlibacter sp.]|uniref:porin n=1 Tax=Ramlibacter sp. TaxID=1917967 RepID=UPI003D13D408